MDVRVRIKTTNTFLNTFSLAAVRLGSYRRCYVDDAIADACHLLALGSLSPNVFSTALANKMTISMKSADIHHEAIFYSEHPELPWPSELMCYRSILDSTFSTLVNVNAISLQCRSKRSWRSISAPHFRAIIPIAKGLMATAASKLLPSFALPH